MLKRYDHLTATHFKDIDSFSHQRFFNMFRNAERAVMESNAHRRSLGMDALDKFVEGDYYKVKSRSINGSTDIALISSGGNIACTSPSYARWGIPSKHIFAVFYDGGMCINMKQHFHSVYHLPFMNDIAVNLVADFTATADIQNGQAFSTDSTTSWNWAQQTSSDSWELIGLGGAEFSSVAHPTARSISKAPESSIERTKKAINYLVPYINNSL